MFRTATLARYAALAIAFTLTACATAPAPAVAPAGPAKSAAPAFVRIVYWTGGCFYSMTCRDETFTLNVDGGFTFESSSRPQAEPATIKRNAGALAPKAFADALAVLEASKFETMPARMQANVEDWKPDFGPCLFHAPWVRITRQDAAGGSREIAWDSGCISSEMTAFTTALTAAMQTDAMQAGATRSE
jgi:hypothetical protein